PTWSDEKAHPISRSPKVHRRRVWVNSAREDRGRATGAGPGSPDSGRKFKPMVPVATRDGPTFFAERDLWNILGGLLRFDVGGTYHLAPLLRFICDELAEVGRGAGKCAGSEFGNSRLDLKIGKSSVNFLVELEHDFGGYIFRRGDTEPRIGLITRQEFGYGWNVWQIAPTLACRNRQCAQHSALDVLHRGDRPKEGNLHPAAKQIGICSARAPVGYMQQVDAGRQLE